MAAVPPFVLNGVNFLFFDLSHDIVQEWDSAFAQHVPDVLRPRIKTLECKLEELPEEHLKFDCILSPANSYGRLDGSFDYFLSEALAPPNDFNAPTRQAQSVLYQRWRGFAPPGTCTLVPLYDTDCSANKHDCKFIALCPTMRTPENVEWDHEVVYECTWSLLVAIDNHNAKAAVSGEPMIKKIVVPGLATGVGGVNAKRCAVQMALAIKHYVDACLYPSKWSTLQWSQIYVSASEVEETRQL